MANKDKKIFYYEGRFDPANILKGLKQIQQNINGIGIGTDISKSLAKEFSAIEKRLLSLQTKKTMGFSSIAQMDAFEREVIDFQERIKSLSADVSGLKLDFKNIKPSEDLSNQIKNLNVALKDARENLKALQDAGTLKLSNIFEKLNSDIKVKDNDLLNLQTAIEEKDLIRIQTLMNNIRKNSDIEIIESSEVTKAKKFLDEANNKVILLENNLNTVADQSLITARDNAKKLKEQLVDLAGIKLGQLYTKSSGYTIPTAEADENSAKAKQSLVDARKAVDAWREAEAALNNIHDTNRQNLELAKKEQTQAQNAYNEIKQKLQTYESIATLTKVLVGDTEQLTDAQKQAFAPVISWIANLQQARQQVEATEEDMDIIRQQILQIAKTSLDGLVNDLRSMGNATEDVNQGVHRARESLNDLTRKESFFEQLTNYVGMVFSLGDAFQYAERGIRYTFETIKNLDAAFTEIAVVTDLSNQELWDSFDDYNAMAQQLGITTKDAIETSALYYQQGLDTADVMQLTAETVKMARIANMDYAEATDRMTAALRGFKLEMSDAVRVNDVFSALAAASAVDTDELSYALTKTASIAASAGMELETTSALLSQMIETTREAPEKN